MLVNQTTEPKLIVFGLQSQFGLGSSYSQAIPNAPVAFNFTTMNVSQIQANGGATIVLMTNGQLYSTGYNFAVCSSTGTAAAWCAGTLGQGSTSISGVGAFDLTWNEVATGDASANEFYTQIYCGYWTCLAYGSTSGAWFSWGGQGRGGLGSGQYANTQISVGQPTLVDISSLNGQTIQSVAIGSYNTMAILSNGSLASWGYNIALGFGDLNFQTCDACPYWIPQVVPASTSIQWKKVTGSSFHFLGLSTSGVMYGWGCTNYSALGTLIGSSPTYGIPITALTMFGSEVVSDIATSLFTSFALLANGSTYMWGLDIRAPLTTVSIPNPILLNFAPNYGPKTLSNVQGLGFMYYFITEYTAPPVIITPTALNNSQPVPAPIGCSSSPGPDFYCSNGIWYSNSSISAPTLTVTTPTVVIGNLEINSTLTITPVFSSGSSGSSPALTITGCLQQSSDTVISIILSQQDLDYLSSHHSLPQSLITQDGNCSQSLSSLQYKLTQPNSCKQAKVSTSSSTASNFAVLVSVDTSKCNLWWIITAAVVGGILVLLVAGVIVGFVLYRHVQKRVQSDRLDRNNTPIVIQ